jgi:transcriptional regulator with XRE-family HTH domain
MKKRDPHDGEIGKRVRALRLQRGMTQVRLGELLGVTFQQIQKYENGANRISAGRLQRIADVFETPITFFYTGIGEAGKSSAQTTQPEFGLFQSGDVIRLVRAYSQIKERGVRLELLRLTEAIAGN